MPNGSSDDRLWTVAEVANHMRVSNMTVYRLIKSGQLPALRVGKNYRIRGKDLAAYLEASVTEIDRSEQGP
ncbi:MAG: helix-turn-helix domain-containing protein [Nitriliruptorales bacterium]|nr:helix-turn-helix domain-containing protein [Nitriliruptorales bacterium]